MIVDLKSKSGKKEINSVRSQITDRSDLKKFDEFLAKHDTFDFADAENARAARKCCGGDKCCQNINITVGVMK